MERQRLLQNKKIKNRKNRQEEVRWLKKETLRERERKREQTCLSLPSLWYDKFYAQQLCLSIKARGVYWTIFSGRRKEG